jgi:hypothetical protein
MNTKAIIASLSFALAGLGSSVAMASPSASFSGTASVAVSGSLAVSSTKLAYGHGGPVVRDHRAEADCSPALEPAHPVVYPTEPPSHWRGGWGGQPMPQIYRPVTLASALHFANDGRTFITVGSQRGQFGTLQISAAAGRTFIKQVYVQFDNGQEQVIRNIDRTLVGSQSLKLDLDGGRRNIRRIVVYGNELNNGWRRAAGTFTVTAS